MSEAMIDRNKIRADALAKITYQSGSHEIIDQTIFACEKHYQAAASHYEQENAELTKEAAWIRNRLCLPADVKLLTGDITLAGAMHKMVSHAKGYVKYIEAFKCDDKQGEIARQSVLIAEQEQQIQSLLALVEKQKELMREVDRQLEEGFVRCETCGEQEDTKDFDCRNWLAEAIQAQSDSCRLVNIGIALENIKTGQFYHVLQPSDEVADDTIRQLSERGDDYGNKTELFRIETIKDSGSSG